jgi:uncharacterized protein
VPNGMSKKPVALAIFVKTPGFSKVKTRLGQGIGQQAAEKFHELSCGAVKSVVQRAVPYWAVAEKLAVKHPLWRDFPTLEQGSGELGDRLSKVYDELMERYPAVIFIGGDSPMIRPEDLLSALRAVKQGDRFVMGLTEDGGFWLFAGSKPVPRKVWTDVTYSDWETGAQLQRGLTPIAPVRPIETHFDIDQREDLARLKRLFASRKDLLPEQIVLSKWLNN